MPTHTYLVSISSITRHTLVSGYIKGTKMEKINRKGVIQQKVGGVAALYLALAYLAAMPYFLIVVDYPGAITSRDKVVLILGNFPSMYAMYLVTYVLFGLLLGVLALALYDRLRIHAPVVMRIATAIGLLWASTLVASGMVFNYGMGVIVALAEIDLVQAQQTWQAIEPVAMGLGGAGGELLGGLWVLLVSSVALRSGSLPKLLDWLGMVIGVAGLVSVIPVLHDVGMVFGILQILWLVWFGVVLLTTKQTN
ncbi:MAG: hypothetical protein CVV48_17060 [Spirochaetae bacterium HGW-Spirochaetae-4]|nr:MAG: hypothetical protein CVV48_17060 [Spirochaetae bacterium HGW-Spirochaetae-4]